MKILIDMNLSPRWCQVLARHGHTCAHWVEIGEPTARDQTIMQWAFENDCTVLTHDLDFGAMLAATQAAGPSVIKIRTQDPMSASFEALLVRALQEFEDPLESGALVVVDERRSRVRMLPLSL